MSSPTDELKHEHDVVLVVVEAMEREARAVESGGRVDGERVTEMVDFARNFTDGCHHAKEESVLFPLLERRQAAAGGPVSVMLSEHEAGRRAIRAIDEALPEAASSDAARAAIAENLAAYANLLRLHIGKENTVLFPLAERILDEKDKRHLAAEFERVEAEETGEGVHERYHAMAHRLAEARES